MYTSQKNSPKEWGQSIIKQKKQKSSNSQCKTTDQHKLGIRKMLLGDGEI